MDVAMRKETTSEEKLLKLIRKKKGEAKQGPLSLEQKVEKQEVSKKKKETKSDSLKKINILLVSIFILLSAYAVINYFKSNEQDKFLAERPARTKKSAKEQKGRTKEDVKPYEYYQGFITQRDIFMSPWEKPNDPTASNVTASEFSNQYKLVGIVLDDNPQAILEETATGQSVFVHKGDTVGNARVEEIHEGKVILLYNNEKIELVP